MYFISHENKDSVIGPIGVRGYDSAGYVFWWLNSPPLFRGWPAILWLKSSKIPSHLCFRQKIKTILDILISCKQTPYQFIFEFFGVVGGSGKGNHSKIFVPQNYCRQVLWIHLPQRETYVSLCRKACSGCTFWRRVTVFQTCLHFHHAEHHQY